MKLTFKVWFYTVRRERGWVVHLLPLIYDCTCKLNESTSIFPLYLLFSRGPLLVQKHLKVHLVTKRSSQNDKTRCSTSLSLVRAGHKEFQNFLKPIPQFRAVQKPISHKRSELAKIIRRTGCLRWYPTVGELIGQLESWPNKKSVFRT